MPRTAIAREQKQFIKIAFAVHLSAAISAERYRSDSGALKSAMLTLVYFYIIMIVHKCRQSAAQSCSRTFELRVLPFGKTSGSKLLNFISCHLSDVFPLLEGSGKTMAFENRRGKYKEIGKKVPQAYRAYVKLILRSDAGDARIFVNVELDEETGLYYYGARYLDPKYSRWLSGDPAITDYMAGSSAGEGGVYNTVNLHVYHYAGIGQRSDIELQANNPVKYVDPDGRSGETTDTSEGREIHRRIFEIYKLLHEYENVTGNTISMSREFHEAGKVDKGLGRTDLGLKPDIWNMTTNELYEIKPETQGAKVAREDALLYMYILKKYGESDIHLGSSDAAGTFGSFDLNENTSVFYHSPEAGVILYSKITNPESDSSKGKVVIAASACTAIALYVTYKLVRTALVTVVCPPLAPASILVP